MVGNTIDVQTEEFVSIIRDQRFDFVKIDIEGAETSVILSASNLLTRLQRVFVEFHSFVDRRQCLGDLISAFENAGFRVHIHPPFISKSPFCGVKESNGMDMQLNLFFWKECYEDG